MRPRSSMIRRVAAIGLVAGVVTLIGAAPGFAKEAIRWHGCGPDQPSNLQCGELAVPLDYSDPGGAKITLGFNRLPAQDRAQRIGSLITNPGGPGPASIAVAVEAAAEGALLGSVLLPRDRSTPAKAEPRGARVGGRAVARGQT